MNVFNKVAFQSLKKNRVRTLVTILGVALSAALITAVAAFIVSLQNYMINGAIAKSGNWHAAFSDANNRFIQEQQSDNRVTNVASFENIGYAMLDGGKNPDKPYLFIAGFYTQTADTLPVNLLSGRFPANGNEIIVPAHVASNAGVKISTEDILTLSIGSRQVDGDTLCQLDPYRADNEMLTTTIEKSYRVVGIYQRPAYEEQSAPGYTAITLADTPDSSGSFSTFVTLKEPITVHSYIKSLSSDYAYSLNDNVLRFMGVSNDKIFNMLLFSIGGILIALVMAGSMFLIYNSFNISLNERTHQFGILMSVGATEKQLRNSVLFEGLCIGTVGIPLGILIGIPGIALVLSLAAKNFENVLYDNVPLTLKVSFPALIIAAIISLITILVSAGIPARKAARTPVMECIRQTNELKVESKVIKTSRFADRFYGLEEHLAIKNFKRNRQRYRSIILSLILSVVLFVSTNTFVTYLKQTAEQARVVTDYDVGFGTQDMNESEMLTLYNKLKTVDGITSSSYQAVMEYICVIPVNVLTTDYKDCSEEDLSNETVNLSAEIHFLDDETYLQTVKHSDLPAVEFTGPDARLIAIAKIDDQSGQAESIQQLRNLFTASSVNVTAVPRANGEQDMKQGKNINITCIEIVAPDTPPYVGIPQKHPYIFQIMAPWSLKETILPADTPVNIKVKGLTFLSKDPSKSTQQMQKIIDGAGLTSDYMLVNTYALLEESRNILFIVNLFTVVFIAMISLIAVANVFNTISTNIKLRRRELAMLRSIGMSDRDFNKMMGFECLLYGIRSLLLGLPLALLLSWMIYKGMEHGGAVIKFAFPWTSILISISGVFFVIFISMLYSTGKIRKENIIDSLRDDMT